MPVPPPRCLALCLALTVPASTLPAAEPLPVEQPAQSPLNVTEAEPLFDMEKSAQSVSMRHFRMKLHVDGLINKSDGRADFVGEFSRVDGEWTGGSGRTPGYNGALHTVEVVDGKSTDDRIEATLKLTIKPDRWVPKDGKPREVVFHINVKRASLDKDGDNDPSTAGQFWRVFPKTGEAQAAVAGTYRIVKSPYDEADKEVGGRVSGTLAAPIAPNRWNAGVLSNDDQGMQLQLDLGDQRGNWNHARLALMGFQPPRDLRDWDGLRLRVDTDEPRDDVHVAVWLREADGSWYYVKHAVPLIDKSNRAVLRFSDFSEAEWVSPTNHMDEDYVLDRSAIAEIGIGVVNSLGVGEVNFELRGIELVNIEKDSAEPAVARVTGKLLSISGHTLVPPGIFGGYAPDLPQKFRPGSQRYLYAGHYPRIPDQHAYRLGAHDIVDYDKALAVLRNTDDPRVKQLQASFEGKDRRKLDRMLKSKALPKDEQDRHRALRRIAEALNEVLRHRDAIYHAESFAEVAFERETAALLSRLKDGQLTDTECMRLNRILLFHMTDGAVARPGPPAQEAFYVDCLGERKEPAWLLQSSNWEQRLDSLGRSFAKHARANDYIAHFEFWNEPYLNWAERSRVHYNLRFYNTDAAGEDKPVQVRYGDGTLGPVIPHLGWRKTGKGKWQVYDTTAFSYWSGRGNGWIYDQMFGVVAKAIKEENPATRVIAGWGFRWHEDHWAAWDMLYKPTIDRNIEYIDAIHEHHYQGDTTAINGSYEVLTAYGVTEHDKWLYSYNTETNDLVDAPARGAIDTPEKAANAKNYRRMTYNLRDMLYCVYQSPDKAVARALIHWSATLEGSTICLEMLKNLRGRLIETQSPDPDIWVVASVDGTDPDALPTGYDMSKDPQQLVVFVFNNHREPREVDLHVTAPAGTTLASQTLERVTVDPDTYDLAYDKTDTLGPRDVATARQRVKLTERGVWKATYELSGRIDPNAGAQVARDQHFSADILQTVQRDKPFKTTVALEPAKVKTADRAWLRLVTEDIERGEATVTVGEQSLAVPHAIVGDNNNRMTQIPLDVKQLTPETTVTFRVADGNFAGYRVDMTSIVLEQRD